MKLDASKRYGLARAPKLVEIIAAVPDEYKSKLLPRLKAKPVRTASGIAVVAVMSKVQPILETFHCCPGLTSDDTLILVVLCVEYLFQPHRCPHIATTGNICVYCPGGPDSDFEYSTQSYTGYEPTSMRAIRGRYDPYVQARSRLDQISRLGHSIDKVWPLIFLS